MNIRTSLKMIKLSAIVFASMGVIFGAKYYQSNQQNKKLRAEIQLEKIMHSSELEEIFSRYDAEVIKNKQLKSAVKQNFIGGSLLVTKNKSTFEIPDHKQEAKSVVATNAQSNLNFNLIQDMLNEKYAENKALANQLEILNAKYKELLRQNAKNELALKTSENLTATNVYANGIKIVSNNIIETKRFSNTEQIKVCFSLLENRATVKGNKDIFIQIINPKNKVVSKNGDFKEFGEKSLYYSAKTNIFYDNEELDVCVFVDSNKNDLVKGDYEINIFSGTKIIGNTIFSLK